MRFLLDADALIKLNIAGVLETFASAYECATPYAVYREVVLDARANGHQDADELDQIISRGLIEVIAQGTVGSQILGDGESAILSVLTDESDGLPVSDDRRFHSELRSRQRDYLPVAAAVALMAKDNVISVAAAIDALELLRPLVRDETFHDAVRALGGDG